MVVRNVGWHANGTTPSKTGGAFVITKYCTNIPTVANASAGQLSLETSFSVRPEKLTGYYKYKLCDANLDDTEKAKVTVTVYDSSNAVVGQGSVELGAQAIYTPFNVPVTYTVLKKANKIKIMITSSNRAEGSVKVSDHLGEHEASKYGAILTVDNLSFSYK